MNEYDGMQIITIRTQLPEDEIYVKILKLRLDSKLSYRDIARTLKISQRTVSNVLKDAKRKYPKKIAKLIENVNASRH